MGQFLSVVLYRGMIQKGGSFRGLVMSWRCYITKQWVNSPLLQDMTHLRAVHQVLWPEGVIVQDGRYCKKVGLVLEGDTAEGEVCPWAVEVTLHVDQSGSNPVRKNVKPLLPYVG